MKSESTLLALDIGSSSARCRLYGADLRGMGSGEGGVRRYAWTIGGGAMEVDATALLSHVAEVIDAGVAVAAEKGLEVAGVAVTTFWHSVVGLDRTGTPVTPLYGWGDSRAAAAAGELRSRLDPEKYHRRTGCFLHTSYPPAKILWLREREPDAFGAAAVWASFGAYFDWQLFGAPRCSISMASGSGFLDAHTLAWDSETLAAVGIGADMLPSLVDLDASKGLGTSWAERWPSLAEVPWFPALGDGACANVGVGAVGRDRPGVSIGTSAAARVVTEAAPDDEVPDDLWCYRVDRRHRIVGGALSNGGNGLSFLRTSFPQLDLAEVDRALLNHIPDAHGLTAVPSLIPERGLGWTEIRSATITGMRPTTSPRDIAVAWVEAISQRIAELIARLEIEYGEAVEVRATGGALYRLRGWVQTISDATGKPVRLGADREATCRGAAVVAARELGWLSSILPPDGDTAGGESAQPRPDHRPIHRAALARQRSVAHAIRQAYESAAPVGAPPANTEPDLA